MSAHDISEHVRAPASEPRPSAGPLSIADPVPVGIAGFGMTTFILSCVKLGINPADRLPIAGYVGIACGVTAWYVAFAHVANATFGRELFPVWTLK